VTGNRLRQIEDQVNATQYRIPQSGQTARDLGAHLDSSGSIPRETFDREETARARIRLLRTVRRSLGSLLGTDLVQDGSVKTGDTLFVEETADMFEGCEAQTDRLRYSRSIFDGGRERKLTGYGIPDQFRRSQRMQTNSLRYSRSISTEAENAN